MKLEDQVVSLELAIKLKELGFKKESLFYWDTCFEPRVTRGEILDFNGMKDLITYFYSAFTASELLEILPEHIDGYQFNIRKVITKEYTVFYEKYIQHDGLSRIFTTTEYSLPCSLAKMLIYIIENKLMEVPE